MTDYFVVKGKDLGKGTGKLIPISKVSDNYSVHGTIDQPYDFTLLKSLKTADTTHGSAINRKVRLVTGFGYEILNRNTISDKAKRFLEYPSVSLNISLYDLIEEAYTNAVMYGNIHFEVVKVADRFGLFVAPTEFIRIKPIVVDGEIRLGSVDKYLQIINGNIANEYEPISLNMDNVKHYIYAVNYNRWLNGFMGSPAYDNAIPQIIINKLISEYDINFFENSAMPDLLITIVGGGLDTAGKNKIRTEIESNLKGVTNSHKTAILSTRSGNAEIKVIPITKDSIDKFTSKYSSYSSFINVSHGFNGSAVSNIRSDGSKNILGNIKADLETLIIPEQTKLEIHIKRLFNVLLGEEIDFKFKKPDLMSAKDRAIIHNLYYGMGAIGIKEIRNSAMSENVGIKNPNDLPEDIKIIDNPESISPDNTGRVIGNIPTDNHDSSPTDITV